MADRTEASSSSRRSDAEDRIALELGISESIAESIAEGSSPSRRSHGEDGISLDLGPAASVDTIVKIHVGLTPAKIFTARSDELKSRSAFFRGLLNSELEEASTLEVRLPEADVKSFELILPFLSPLHVGFHAMHGIAKCSYCNLQSMARLVDFLQIDNCCLRWPFDDPHGLLTARAAAEAIGYSNLVECVHSALYRECGFPFCARRARFMELAVYQIAFAKHRVFLQLFNKPGVFPLTALCELQAICLEKFINGCHAMLDDVTYIKLSTNTLMDVDVNWAREVACAMNSQGFSIIYDGNRGYQETAAHALTPDVFQHMPWLAALPFHGCASGLVRPVVVGGALSNLFHKRGFDFIECLAAPCLANMRKSTDGSMTPPFAEKRIVLTVR